MLRRNILISAAVLGAALTFVGCTSDVRRDSDIPIVAAEEAFLPRPRFDKPAARPLSRFLLTWDSVDGAEGYQIQMSENQNFVQIDRAWTIKGNNLELPIEDGQTLFFRIRSFDESTTSRWSAVLEVKEELL
jgi:hypothetical protein